MHELFYLAIYKTVKQQENNTAVNKIMLILNKRFSFSGKLYRFIKYIVMPMVMNENYKKKEEMKDKIRVNLLIGNKLKFLQNFFSREERIPDKLEAKTKKTVLESMIVPSTKTIFKRARHLDMFLKILRQKAAK